MSGNNKNGPNGNGFMNKMPFVVNHTNTNHSGNINSNSLNSVNNVNGTTTNNINNINGK